MNNTTAFGDEGAPDGNFFPPGWPFDCFPLPGLDFSMGPPPPGYYANISTDLWKYITPFIIGIGTFGNVVTIIILLRQYRRLTSTALFLLTLAVSDTIFLLLTPLNKWVKIVWERDIREESAASCKIHLFLTYVCAQFSSWLLVGVTVERAVSVVWPHRIKFGFNKRMASVIITSMFVFLCGINAHFFYGWGADTSLNPLCQEINDDERYKTFYYDIWPWIDFSVVFAVPFAILLVGNISIILTVYRTRRNRRQMSIIKSESEKVFAKDARNLTATLIVLNTVFFICLSPVSVFFIYMPFWDKAVQEIACVDGNKFVTESEKILMVHAIVNLISYINAALNFFLYVLSGSKFRNEVIALLKCKTSTTRVFGSNVSSSTRRSKMSQSSLKASQKEHSSTSSFPNGSVTTDQTETQSIRL